MATPLVACADWSTQPNRYSGAQLWLFAHAPSMPASLVGWYLVMTMAIQEPKTKTCSALSTAKNGSATLMPALASSTWRFFSRYQAHTLSISDEPTIQALTQMWSRLAR